MTRALLFLAFFVLSGCRRRCLEAKEVTEYWGQGGKSDQVFPQKHYVCVKWEVEK